MSKFTYISWTVYALYIQAHDMCTQLHDINLSDLRGKTIGKV